MAQYARNSMRNLRVISINEEKGTFSGENLELSIIYTKEKISDYYFYDFC